MPAPAVRWWLAAGAAALLAYLVKREAFARWPYEAVAWLALPLAAAVLAPLALRWGRPRALPLALAASVLLLNAATGPWGADVARAAQVVPVPQGAALAFCTSDSDLAIPDSTGMPSGFCSWQYTNTTEPAALAAAFAAGLSSDGWRLVRVVNGTVEARHGPGLATIEPTPVPAAYVEAERGRLRIEAKVGRWYKPACCAASADATLPMGLALSVRDARESPPPPTDPFR